MLKKEKKCLKRQELQKEKDIKTSVRVEDVCVNKTRGKVYSNSEKFGTVKEINPAIGSVLRDLDILSDNIVKYLNMPKTLKKKKFKK